MALYFFLANTPTTQQFSLHFRLVALVCSLGSPVYTFHSPTKHRHDPHQWPFISSTDDTTILTSFQACGACMPPWQPQRFPFRSLPLLPPATPRFDSQLLSCAGRPPVECMSKLWIRVKSISSQPGTTHGPSMVIRCWFLEPFARSWSQFVVFSGPKLTISE